MSRQGEYVGTRKYGLDFPLQSTFLSVVYYYYLSFTRGVIFSLSTGPLSLRAPSSLKVVVVDDLRLQTDPRVHASDPFVGIVDGVRSLENSS